MTQRHIVTGLRASQAYRKRGFETILPPHPRTSHRCPRTTLPADRF